MSNNNRNWTSLSFLLLTAFAVSARAGDDEPSLLKSVSFYASFDERLAGDLGGGDLSLSTRVNHETEKGTFVFTKGYNHEVFRVARNKGVHGGALEAVDVLPRNGRIFFPAQGNIAYRKGGWGGAVSFWLNTDPNKLLKTPFCDPVQITEKGAGNGGVWCDFPDVKPRDMRLGAFPAVPAGQTPIPESDPLAPLVIVKDVGFKTGDWHHVVLSWKNFDTGKDDAQAALYVDGNFIGQLTGRQIAMNWNLDKAGIYVAVSYIGLLDEFAVFNRTLSVEEIALLHGEPSLLAPLAKKEDRGDRQSAAPAPPKLPFDASEARKD
ncbi:MAG: hypothetical protein O3C40_35205 [Planctomycetota bacterium]|nr:hypothetical protein [Planctomycetota bacterium]